MLSLGDRLRLARERIGYTQKQVAKKINISDKTISHYENNVVEPGIEVIRKFIVLYDISLEYILGFSSEMGQMPGSSKTAPQIIRNSAAHKKLDKLSDSSYAKAEDYIDMLITLEEVDSANDPNNQFDFKKKA